MHMWILISTHTSLAGRDLSASNFRTLLSRFLLTRPSRDVTNLKDTVIKMIQISTHTSLAGRDGINALLSQIGYISTHTSLAGRDILRHLTRQHCYTFLLTRPSRDVTLEE